ncbi:MAG: SagB/ThcOx family dehydrogenase [Clostridium sp.]|jgi:SagB-type dehydrogenase family enzyme|nr:SagB/ThcOx family dehydrogenase [Clostridium sp.]
MEEKIFYWSPSINWKVTEGKLKIERFIYTGDIVKLFPEFYYIAQDGIDLNKITDLFPDVSAMRIKVFIKDLIKRNILIDSIMSPNQVFYPQKKFVKHSYSKNLMYDPNEIKEYKAVQLNRKYEYHNDVIINLKQTQEFPKTITERKSHREFSKDIISFDIFSNLISIFKQISNNNGYVKYYYASAGGLYPIDIYVYIKGNRVEHLNRGLYYYSPIENSLSLVTEQELTEEMHYYSNKEIFNSSAISIFFVYNAQANIPKYGGNGYLYACIDTGIMVSTFTTIAETLGIGLCSIGEMDFKKVSKLFKLNKDQILIHELECGIKKNI